MSRCGRQLLQRALLSKQAMTASPLANANLAKSPRVRAERSAVQGGSAAIGYLIGVLVPKLF